MNFKLASFQVGVKLDAEEISESFKKQYLPFNETKWFIIDFIKFQFGCEIEELNEKNNAHSGAIKVIKEYSLLEKLKVLRNSTVIEGLNEGLIELHKNKNKIGRGIEEEKEKEESLHELQKFIKTTKNISKMKNQLTFDESTKLFERYTKEELTKIFRAMENHLPLCKNNSSVYLTAINWIERDKKK